MFHGHGNWTSLKEKRDRHSKRWNFSYWYTFPWSPVQAQRVFFWDDAHEEIGVVLLSGSATRSYKSIENLVGMLVRDPELRVQYRRELRFPLERHYAELGSFPEEHSQMEQRK
jgi:hypothetical protein